MLRKRVEFFSNNLQTDIKFSVTIQANPVDSKLLYLVAALYRLLPIMGPSFKL